MIPILYPAGETAFTDMGICSLVDATRCLVSEDTDWDFSLEMDYPMNGRFFKEIRVNRVILAEPEPGLDAEPFDIYGFTFTQDGLATFYARHVNYRLEKCTTRAYTSTTSLGNIFTIAANEAGSGDSYFLNDGYKNLFDVTAHLTDSSASYTIQGSYNARELLLKNKSWSYAEGKEPSLEYKFSRFNIDIYQLPDHSRGEFKPLIIRAGSNIAGMTFDLDYKDTVSWVIPWWGDGKWDADQQRYKYNYLTTSTPQATSQYSDVAVNRDGDTEPPDKFFAIPLDCNGTAQILDGEEEPRPAELHRLAVQHIRENNLDVPYCNLTIDYTELDPEMEKAYVFPATYPLRLCDTCTVQFLDIGLVTTLKVVKCVYNVLLERYETLQFGSLERTIFNASSITGSAVTAPEYDVVIEDDPYVPEADPEEITPDSDDVVPLGDDEVIQE